MPTPKPTQILGAEFLARRQYALLADQPRVGKTGAAIMAADMILARRILVITTASGRGVWLRAFDAWAAIYRNTAVITPADRKQINHDVLIVGWASIANPAVRAALLLQKFDLVISDEDHYAKNFSTKRTQSLYGMLHSGGSHLDNNQALYALAPVVWTLTGTPIPHSAADMYPRLRALAPDRLLADDERGWPDVTKEQDFLHRYCIVRMKKISNFNKIPVVIGSKNEDELAARIEGFFLLRTQKDVGIQPPVHETLPMVVTDTMRNQADGKADMSAVLAAIESGSTQSLEMHLGPLRRHTATLKAGLVAEAVQEEFDCGLDKIVLMYWHKDVGDILEDRLAAYGVSRLDGRSTPQQRESSVNAFQTGKNRVFLGQIVAAGEAIDLSAAAVLWFVETSFTPKDMLQASLRITNLNQKRQTFVKVVTLAGSIDEAIQSRLMMLWTGIRKVLSNDTEN
jgi:SNF2 family DNA or RNA helicase